MSLYAVALIAHSWLRWFVLFLGVAVLTRILRTWRGDKAAGVGLGFYRAFLTVLDVQVIVGLALYLRLSPVSRAAFADMGVAMGDSTLRFFAVEHFFGMAVAMMSAHVGYVRMRSAERAGALARDVAHGALAYHAIWLLVTLGSIPWPALPYGRPLFRLIF